MASVRPPAVLHRLTDWVGCVQALQRDVPRRYLATVFTETEPEVREDRPHYDRLCARVEAFLELATADLRRGDRATAPRARRERHLLAMPLFGTGGGGFAYKAGVLIRRYLMVMYRLVRPRATKGGLPERQGSRSVVPLCRHATSAWTSRCATCPPLLEAAGIAGIWEGHLQRN